ncbi:MULTISPECIES: Hpt domain-containing protein [unclassified Pseudomonas]|uniref:Hpt domain-containing protein n=1 Tax=unclassified Pseudomonas TaxID=196821 RepID=UPI002AC9227E|nr:MULTISPECIES: Hpt domain-containing protein [unclassified Pseudomonas]MEB0041434.1 Hpt domain-containing protein [Pseudomonas sp. MH10]MEB0121151.1 Hpt domain-containing protein [Pseudomonas sp. CCI1.2]WPX66406.1 Hpt domain-containing protein [Pseudomonas sp. MH10]
MIHVDYGVLSNLQDVMESEYPILIDTFLDDSEQRLLQLHHALLTQVSCLEGLGMAAHSFKGSSGNMGATRLAELCGQLEERTQRGEMEDAPEWVHKIEREFATVRRLFCAERQRFSE